MGDSGRTYPTTTALQSLLRQLPLALVIFRGDRLVYSNEAALRLTDRLRDAHGVELVVLLRHYLSLWNRTERHPDHFAVTARDQEPFLVHVIPLDGRQGDVATTIRELGPAIDSYRDRYALSPREVQVIELVLRGYSNRDIASSLGVTAATVKKHLSHVFDKVGVDSRAQLASRLA